MRLERFVADRIYGYLDFNIKFNKDITFLTGINGSGKTTIINAINAMLAPSLGSLADLDFKSLKVEFENEGKKGFIEVTKKSEAISISTSASSDLFTFNPFVTTEDIPTFREQRYQREYYRDMAVSK
jgi:predicted ATP-binding protein involved in virulence